MLYHSLNLKWKVALFRFEHSLSLEESLLYMFSVRKVFICVMTCFHWILFFVCDRK